jgi:hypothetical protein
MPAELLQMEKSDESDDSDEEADQTVQIQDFTYESSSYQTGSSEQEERCLDASARDDILR